MKISSTSWTILASRLLPTGQISIGFFNATIITLKDENYSFSYIQDKTSHVKSIHLSGSNIDYLLELQQEYSSVGIQ